MSDQYVIRLDQDLGAQRDLVTKTKHERDEHRQEYASLKQQTGIMNSEHLTKDFKALPSRKLPMSSLHGFSHPMLCHGLLSAPKLPAPRWAAPIGGLGSAGKPRPWGSSVASAAAAAVALPRLRARARALAKRSLKPKCLDPDMTYVCSWPSATDQVQVLWDDVWWNCEVLDIGLDGCRVKYHDGGDVEAHVDVSSRVRKPRRALLGEDSDVEVWLDDLWRPGKVRAVDLDAQLCSIEYDDGEVQEEVPCALVRRQRTVHEGSFMEAWEDGRWREGEVVEICGGSRYMVRFPDGEREVTRLREPAVPLYMLYVGQGYQGVVTKITEEEVLVDIGAEVWGRIPARLFGDSAALLAREEVDLGMQLDVWISGLDAGKQRLELTRFLGRVDLDADVSPGLARFRRYVLRTDRP
ncbi:unnamed protein product [Effrenium voratum]|uniref:S1 motif domain-containing protein n=1 Tax=Effrenium voratum TaxID=2562239 RepID=A0AA36HWW1_9DINO|nr:unnamed protein product [Effrenium voratum]